MDPRECHPVGFSIVDSAVGPQSSYRVSLTILVDDPFSLWLAAASKALAAPGATSQGVIDVLGPSEDPSIEDCIAMLAMPMPLPGCVFDDFWVDGLHIGQRSHAGRVAAQQIAASTKVA